MIKLHVYAVGGAAICCGLSNADLIYPHFVKHQSTLTFVCYNFYLFCFSKSQKHGYLYFKRLFIILARRQPSLEYHIELFEITFLACITELQVDSR